MKTFALAFAIFLAPVLGAVAGNTPAPEGANVYIVSPVHGEVVTSPLKVVFGLSGIGVAPAGIDKANTGHHHLLIDTPVPGFDRPVPTDDNHRHFGGGQTEVVIELSPGTHTLQLLLADFAHTPHNPPILSKQIRITVR